MSDPSAVQQLSSGVSDLRVPEPKADREALLLKVGYGLAVLGALLILLAWFGASGTRDVGEQVPYLISGGLLGLALVIAGTGLVMRYSLARLFRFWLARLLYEHQAQTDRTVDALGRIEALMSQGQGGPAADAPHDGGAHLAPRRSEPLRARPTGE